MRRGMGIKRLQYRRKGAVVTKTPQARNHRLGNIRQIAVMPEGLAGVNVGDVHLNKRYRHRRQGVAKSYAGVGVRRRINDDELGAILSRLMNRFDQFLLTIALQAQQLGARALRFRL